MYQNQYFCSIQMYLRTQYFVVIMFLGSAVFSQLLPNYGGQRAGISSLSFLKNNVNPVTSGMADASIALRGNAFSVVNNPAALTSIENKSFALSNLTLGAGINQSLLSTVFTTKGESKIGFHINSLNSGLMEVRTEFQPEGNGLLFGVSNTAIGLSYAKRLTERFSLGVNTKFIYETVAEYRNYAAAVDVGFLYETDFRDLTFAVVFSNFGSNSKLGGDAMPVTYNRPDVSTSEYGMPTVFKIGFSLTAYEKEKHKILAIGELNHPNDNAENIRFGGEYNYADLIFARLGYMISVKDHKYPTMGMGFRTRLKGRPLYVDYSLNPVYRLGNQHVFGVRLDIL